MPSNRPNIAVVVLDTLRKDAFDKYFDWLPGRRFENAWSPSHWTLPAHAGLYTGRYPSEIGVHAKSPMLDVDEPVLAERLQDADYTTTAYTCNTVVSDPFGFDRGYDHLECLGFQNTGMRHVHDSDLYDWSEFIRQHQPNEAPWRYLRGVWGCLTTGCNTIESLLYGANMKFDLPSFLQPGDDHPDMGGQAVHDRVVDRDVSTSGEFLYLNLMEAHTPYRIPEEYKDVPDEAVEMPSNPVDSLDTDEAIDIDAIRTRYRNAARYLSDVYRDIFDELRADYDYIITLADHGELLGEHGHLAHSSGIYPELTHVPLSVYSGEDTAVTDDSLVSLLDIHRTVLELAGVDASDSRGRHLLYDDLVAWESDAEVLTECHGITFPSENRDQLREWASSPDVAEAYLSSRRGIVIEDYYGYDTIDGFVHEGSPPIPDPQAEIERIADGFETQPTHDEDGTGGDDEELSEEVQANLEDLGYL